MAKKKAEDERERKQVTLRISQENWRRLQMARIQTGMSLQQLLWAASDAYLRKQKCEGLVPEDTA